MIDATMKITRDGLTWNESHWLEVTSIDDPMPKLRVVAIEDGSDDIPPLIAYVLPDRR